MNEFFISRKINVFYFKYLAFFLFIISLWRHHEYHCALEITLLIASLESYVVIKWNLVTY